MSRTEDKRGTHTDCNLSSTSSSSNSRRQFICLRFVFVFVTSSSRGSAHLGAVWHGPQPPCQTGGAVVSTTWVCPRLDTLVLHWQPELEPLLQPTRLKVKGISQPLPEALLMSQTPASAELLVVALARPDGPAWWRRPRILLLL